MKKKQFKTESQKLLDMMINSIYTHKEIFLREILSNASDAIDKLCFIALTDDKLGMTRSDFRITLHADKDSRTLTITDNVSGFKTVCTGVSLQKAPDRTYDRTATNVTYTLLAATVTEQ